MRPTIHLFAGAIALLAISCSPNAEPTPRTMPVQPLAGHEYDGIELAPIVPATGDLPVELRLDPARVVGPASPLLFGLNQSWTASENLMLDRDGAPSAEFHRLAQGLPLPLNRMAGTDSAFFRWKRAIGPMAERTPVPDDYKHATVRRFGPVEWIQGISAIDPAATFNWCFNCLDEEPEDHADLVEFLTGRPGENRNGGLDWAARRVELGLPDPVRVPIWEIGNELDSCGYHLAKFPDAQAFAAYARRTIAAVRQVDPQASFAVTAASAPWGWKRKGDWRGWHRTMLTELGADLDWLVFHPYYDGLPVAEMERYMDVLRDDCRRLVPQHPIKLYLSEHALWPEQEKGKDWKLNWYKTHALGGCLSTSRFLLRMQQRPEVGAAAYHSFASGPWGLFYTYDFVASRQVPLWRTGMADVFTLLKPLASGAVLSVGLAGDRTVPTQNDATFAASAVLRDGRIHLALVNREARVNRLATIAIPGSWRLAGGRCLTAPDVEDCNASGRTSILTFAIAPRPEAFTAWTVPARSVSVLELVPTP